MENLQLKFNITFIVAALLFIYGILISFTFIKGLNAKPNPMPLGTNIEDYPECRFDQCPEYSSMDVDGDRLSESVVVQHTAMTQGAGKVLVIKNGKKIFETEEEAEIGVKAVDDGNGFILLYSSPRDEHRNSINYEVRYTFKNGRFIRGPQMQV